VLPDTRLNPPESELAEFSQERELQQAIERLPARGREVLQRRFGLTGDDPETLEQIGATLQVSGERVRQLEAQALEDLRSLAPALIHYLTE
jgi:RNA polymerase sigma factor (sigma-70 family)